MPWHNFSQTAPGTHQPRTSDQKPLDDYLIRTPEMAREITSCWICSVSRDKTRETRLITPEVNGDR